MNINLTISSQDYGFVVEAIKLRTIALLESFNMDKEAAEQAADKVFEQEPAKPTKKPHWTQTEKGKKIMAARRRKGQK
jgi:hypothetical protein